MLVGLDDPFLEPQFQGSIAAQQALSVFGEMSGSDRPFPWPIPAGWSRFAHT